MNINVTAPIKTMATVLSIPILHPKADGDFALVAIAIGAVLIGFICSCIAVSSYLRLMNARREAKLNAERARHSIRLRDLMLEAGPDALLVFENGSEEAMSVGNARGLLHAGMKGPDARKLADALDQLLKQGTVFALTARTSADDAVRVRGKVAGRRAIVFLRDMSVGDTGVDFQAALEAMDVPVWIRSRDMDLRWANRAYLDAVGAKGLTEAKSLRAVIERSERSLAEAARDGGETMEALRYALIDGKRRALSLRFARLPDATVAGVALDVTPLAQAEANLRLNIDAAADMLEAFPMAIARFGANQRMASYNTAFANMWGFSPDWLDTHPTQGEIFDRLRETRQIPEQHDFQAWKRSRLKELEDCHAASEIFWHLPSGRNLRIQTHPHLLGGVFFVIEDVSEKLRLESSFKLLNQVQRATLDAIDEAIAIFGPDGHLILHNKSFAAMWRMTESDLAELPHFRKLASFSNARIGQDSIWSIVAAGVTSNEPERCSEWGKAPRADGRSISLAMSRLPNGATVVTFTDLTDMERFQTAMVENPNAAA